MNPLFEFEVIESISLTDAVKPVVVMMIPIDYLMTKSKSFIDFFFLRMSYRNFFFFLPEVLPLLEVLKSRGGGFGRVNAPFNEELPGFVAGILIFRTLSRMICLIVFKKAFLKSAVLYKTKT